MFFFNDTATTEIYTLSLHDALPICKRSCGAPGPASPSRHDRFRLAGKAAGVEDERQRPRSLLAPVGLPKGACRDRKSTRLNSSHANISYAVFCLKKKKTTPVLLHSQ